jgi:hypothetical protein
MFFPFLVKAGELSCSLGFSAENRQHAVWSFCLESVPAMRLPTDAKRSLMAVIGSCGPQQKMAAFYVGRIQSTDREAAWRSAVTQTLATRSSNRIRDGFGERRFAILCKTR